MGILLNHGWVFVFCFVFKSWQEIYFGMLTMQDWWIFQTLNKNLYFLLIAHSQFFFFSVFLKNCIVQLSDLHEFFQLFYFSFRVHLYFICKKMPLVIAMIFGLFKPHRRGWFCILCTHFKIHFCASSCLPPTPTSGFVTILYITVSLGRNVLTWTDLSIIVQI